LSQIEIDAVQVLISQISRIWTKIPKWNFNWTIFATEFNLSGKHLNTTDNIQVHQNKPDSRMVEQAIFFFLNSVYQEDPTTTLHIIRKLTKEIVYSINPDSFERLELEDQFAPIFKIAKIPLENTESIPLANLVGKPYRFINESGLGDFILALAQEINVSFNTGCYTSTAFLTRKLLESLVLSILKKQYGTVNKDKYLTDNGRTRNFVHLCKEFWTVYDDILHNLTPVRDSDRQKLENNLDDLRTEFNIDAHLVSTFKKQVDLINVREDIQDLVNFLSNLHSNM